MDAIALLVIDSCRAEGMATAKDQEGFVPKTVPDNLIDELKKGRGRTVFTSSTGKEFSWIFPAQSMSIFTYHFVEALEGKGNRSGDKYVRVSHLMTYLSETVPKSAREFHKAKQTPFYNLATEDYPIALLYGGQGLPLAETLKKNEDFYVEPPFLQPCYKYVVLQTGQEQGYIFYR